MDKAAFSENTKRATLVPDAVTATKRLFTISAPADRSRVTLTMQPDSGAFGQITLTPNGLLGIIQSLGRVHAAIREGQRPSPQTPPPQPVAGVSWRVGSSPARDATTMTFDHPGFGQIGFQVPIEQVRQMIELLQQQVAVAEAASRTPRN